MHRFHVLIRPVAAGSLAAAVLLLSGAGTAKAAPAGPHARGDGRIAAARAVAGGAGGPSVRFSAGAPDRANRGAALRRSALEAVPHLAGGDAAEDPGAR
ncbi:hypothetical protein [Streptomyces sp. NPDC052292]|uniref:hypothetical protein n=1 Tax=Streptomyces sp. NPDC052292 TaxID=3155053 RepID=UPI0034191E4C